MDLNVSLESSSQWLLEVARDINNHGQVVGIGKYDGQPHAFLWHEGSVTDLGNLGSTRNYQPNVAINDAGQVVMTASQGAFLYRDEARIKLDSLLPPDSRWTFKEARAINNAGQIVGSGMLNGQQLSV